MKKLLKVFTKCRIVKYILRIIFDTEKNQGKKVARVPTTINNKPLDLHTLTKNKRSCSFIQV